MAIIGNIPYFQTNPYQNPKGSFRPRTKTYYTPLKRYQAPNTFNKYPINKTPNPNYWTKYPLNKPPILWLGNSICSFNWLTMFCRQHTHSSLNRSLLTFLLKSTQTTNKHQKKNLKTSIKPPLIMKSPWINVNKPSVRHVHQGAGWGWWSPDSWPPRRSSAPHPWRPHRKAWCGCLRRG